MTMKIVLEVQVQYKGTKASQLYRSAVSGGSNDDDSHVHWNDILCADLRLLKISWQPRPEHTKIMRRSAVFRFSWETDKDSSLHRNLEKQVRRAMKSDQRELREEVCVKNIELTIRPPYTYNEIFDRRNYSERDHVSRRRSLRRISASPTCSSRTEERQTHGECRRSTSASRFSASLATSSNRTNTVGMPNSFSTPQPENSQSTGSLGSSLSPISSRATLSHFFDLPQSDSATITKRNPLLLDRSQADASTTLTKFDLTLTGLKELQMILDEGRKKNAELHADLHSESIPTLISDDENTVSEKLESHETILDPEVEEKKDEVGLKKPIEMNIEQVPIPYSSNLKPHLAIEPARADVLATPDNDRDRGKMRSASSSFSSNTATFEPTSISRKPLTQVSSQMTSELTRELWNIRRQRTALVARETYLVSALNRSGRNEEDVSNTQLLLEKIQTLEKSLTAQTKELNHSKERLAAAEMTYNAAQAASRAEQQLILSERQQLAHLIQKLEIARGRKVALQTSLADCQKELRVEQQRRSILEHVIEDMQRETKTPLVVPELVEAMMKITDISSLVENGAARRAF